jgi:peroxiredoxin 2/4
MKTLVLFVIVVFCSVEVWSQGSIPLLGNPAPSFEANTTNGKLNFPGDFGKSWKILFSHPKDFTPVCTSEILALAKMQNEFNDLGVKIAIISTDDVISHKQWKQSMEDIFRERNDTSKIYFPFIDDNSTLISNKYGMLHAWENTTRDVRGVFVIDPDNVIQTIIFYPMNLGRNMDEIKRVVVALQTSKKSDVLMPANWKSGGDVLMRYAPYTESDLKENPDLKNQFYKVGVNMWFKKGQGK